MRSLYCEDGIDEAAWERAMARLPKWAGSRTREDDVNELADVEREMREHDEDSPEYQALDRYARDLAADIADADWNAEPFDDRDEPGSEPW